MRAAPILLLALLAACGPDLPPGTFGSPPDVTLSTRPELVPLDPILTETVRPATAEPAGEALTERTEDLLLREVPDPPDADLAARGEALRRRAADLRAVEL
jgi:hypothetical protein